MKEKRKCANQNQFAGSTVKKLTFSKKADTF